MAGSMRWSRWALTSVVTLAGFGLVQATAAAVQAPATEVKTDAKDKPKAAAPVPAGARPADWRSKLAEFFSQPGDDPPRPSVPLRPATVDDRRRLEATRLYTAARAMEDRGLWSDAVDLLQQASKLDPDSVAIARRLAKIYVGALGRPDLANPYARRVLASEPGDTETFSRLADFYIRRGEPESAETVLKEVLANPRLPATPPAGSSPSSNWGGSTRPGSSGSTRPPTPSPTWSRTWTTSRPTGSPRARRPASSATNRPAPT